VGGGGSTAGQAGSAGASTAGSGGQGGSAGSVASAGTGAAGQGGTAGGAGTGGTGGASGSAGTSGVSSGGGDGVSHVPRLDGALKILPFGDSITASTCYRARLAEMLDASHPGDYDFVGTQNGDKGCGYTYDMAHEGHGGYLITQHTGEFTGWASASPADVVLLHFATNDVWNAVSTENILAAYGQAVDAFRAQNENVTILVAKLIPLEPDGCGHCNVATLNDAIPAWAESKASATSPIIVVDQFTGYSAGADSDDKVHPNDAGSDKMATHWATALDPLF
jgi:lysophospholipase L1-like esterase